MAQVIVRNLEDQVVARLKRQAADNERSLEQELRLILTAAASPDLAEFRDRAAVIRASLSDRPQTDSVDLIREDRDR